MKPDPHRHDPIKVLRSAAGAFDLPSILVGVVVVGVLTAGVLASVFGIIPFTQDKGAQQDLSSVTTAQGVAKAKEGRYEDLAGLGDAGYIEADTGLAIGTDAAGSCFVAVSQSGSGETFIATSENPTPVSLAGASGIDCISATSVNNLIVEAGGTPTLPAGVMTTVWNTGGECSTITVPLTGTIDATIDWGDGKPVQHVTEALPTHTYPDAPGTHTITIDGMFTGWAGEDWFEWSYGCLTQVTEWGETGTIDAEGGFYDTNLTHLAGIPSTVTKMGNLFTNSDFNGDISDWDTSRVTSMSAMFFGASFNGDISEWDTSQVTNMYSMFYGSDFTGDISGWDTSKVTDMEQMFYESVFAGDISKWNTSQVTDMKLMFMRATAFNSDISGWDVSKVADMSSMFQDASSFSQDLSGWKTSSLTQGSWFSWGSPLTPAQLPAGTS